MKSWKTSIGVSALITTIGFAIWYQQHQQQNNEKKGRKKLIVDGPAKQPSFSLEETIEELHAVLSIESASKSSIIDGLQRVFYALETRSSSATSLKPLIDSFGWSQEDTFVQHDVQELCRLLLEQIENKVIMQNGTKNIVQQLFEGKIRSYIQCLHVDCNSVKDETFYDLQMDVKSCRSLQESFAKYLKPEFLVGENRYHSDQFGLQDAKKGVQFLELPTVLMLHLKRFDFDVYGGQHKINQRFEFSDELDLQPFVSDKSSAETKYTLHAVLVHSGTQSGAGHYYSYINVSKNTSKKKWCKFDDEKKVKEVSETEAILGNFGGVHSSHSAYMLVYIKQSESEYLLKDTPIPESLKSKLGSESSCSIQ